MVRHKLIEVIEEFDFESLRLKYLFPVTVDEAITFLVSVGALKNSMKCDKCNSAMNVQKRTKVIDGIHVNIKILLYLNFDLVGLSQWKNKVFNQVNSCQLIFREFQAFFADLPPFSIHVGF
jgi:hypothetical protein